MLDDFRHPCYNFKLRGLCSAEFPMRFRRTFPVLTELASREKVIGVKQSARAIRDGRAKRVFLACDADEAC